MIFNIWVDYRDNKGEDERFRTDIAAVMLASLMCIAMYLTEALLDTCTSSSLASTRVVSVSRLTALNSNLSLPTWRNGAPLFVVSRPLLTTMMSDWSPNNNFSVRANSNMRANIRPYPGAGDEEVSNQRAVCRSKVKTRHLQVGERRSSRSSCRQSGQRVSS